MDLKNKKILITGAHGFLGNHLVNELLRRGVPQKNISAPASEELDLRLKKNCERAVQGIEVVFHLAGITGSGEFHKANPGRILYENLVMGVELMEAARKAGVEKFLSAGNATEYPESALVPFREEDLWRGRPEPLHLPYTIAKKMLSVQSTAYRDQYHFNAVHLILTNMYGPGQVTLEGVIPNLIDRVAKTMQAGQKSFEVWGTGNATRDFLYVADTANAFILAAERYDGREPVNVGSGWEITIAELARFIAEAMDFKGEIRFDPSKPEGALRRVLDTSRAYHAFGWTASTDFETGLRNTIDWYNQTHGTKG